MGSIVKPECILASNTSSLSITKLAQVSPIPSNIIGLHFFNPVPLMKLVEIIYTDYNNQEIIKLMEDYVTIIGKTPVMCKDTPGFIVNRLLVPYLAQVRSLVVSYLIYMFVPLIFIISLTLSIYIYIYVRRWH